MRARSRGLTILRSAALPVSFAGSSFAYYCLMSTFMSYWHDVLSVPAALSSSILAGYVLTARLSKVPLGPLIDRISLRRGMQIAALAAALCFALLSVPGLFVTKVVALCAAGIPISSIVLLTQAVAARSAQSSARKVLAADFSIIYWIMSCMSLLAPFYGFFLLRNGSGALYLSLCVLYMALFCVAGWLDPAPPPLQQTPHRITANLIQNIPEQLRQPSYRKFLTLYVIGWFLCSQLFSTLPLFAERTLGGTSGLPWLFAVDSLATVALQRWISRHLTPQAARPLFAATFLTFAAAFALLSVGTGIVGLATGVLAFSCAKMLFFPGTDGLSARLAKRQQFATGFGLMSVAAAAGDSAGTAWGVRGYEALRVSGYGRAYFLIVASCAALIGLVVLLTTLRRRAVEYDGDLISTQHDSERP